MRVWAIALAASLAAGGVEAKQDKRRNVAEAPGSAQGRVDPNGVWTLEATTTVGDCPSLMPGAMTIVENKLADGSDAKVAAWGYVDGDGVIVARFTGEGARVARLHGALKGGKGSGAWSSSTDLCGGAWKAEQQKSAAAAPLSRLAEEGGGAKPQP